MNREKLGFVLLGVAVAWALAWGVVVGAVFVNPLFRTLTMDELQETIWAPPGPMFFSWAFAVPLAALVGTIGVSLYAGVHGSRVWLIAGGTVLTLIVAMAGAHGLLGHFPPVFAVGGAVIVLSFFGILLLWAKERRGLAETARTAADLRLVGYLFILIGGWYVCGIASMPFFEAVRGLPTTSPIHSASSPIHVMIFLALGWVFLFLGQYRARAG